MSEARPGSTRRVIDANANRAREGLRVAEDFARFVAGEEDVARSLRALRHEVTRCVRLVAPDEKAERDLLAARDVEGDGGASPESFAPAARADMREIVTSAFKRAEEALRSLEEFTKLPEVTNGMEASAGFERARYVLYELEKKTLLAVPPACACPNADRPARDRGD
jgi:thiamine-phosphate pyrophosphorylase